MGFVHAQMKTDIYRNQVFIILYIYLCSGKKQIGKLRNRIVFNER
jgi:hypothetical protein